MTEQQKETATQLFAKWQHVFSRGPTDLGHTNLVKHEIKLTEEKPFKEPFRRISPAMIEEVREHIAEMLEADAIRPSQSPFSSNVVLVRRKTDLYASVLIFVSLIFAQLRMHRPFRGLRTPFIYL